jgi:YVTN family beta-propeller protein
MDIAKALRIVAALAMSSAALYGQAQTAATFGTVVGLGGTPSDAVLDEVRGRIYLVNDRANRVDVYGIPEKRVINNVRVGTRPLAAAMSWDGNLLFVTNDLSSSLSVVDLGRLTVIQTVTLPARPEGVAAGIDGRVLISTVGTGTGNPPRNTLLIFDRTAAASQQILEVNSPPPPSTPTPLPPTTFPRPQTTFRGKLAATPDGQFIVGVTTPTNATYMFVYEVASGVILRSRNVGGQSTVLSMSPDGAHFMAGFTMYETATLAAVAQMNLANAPFVFPGSFNVTANQGGSAFSPDNNTIYSAFNAAGNAVPAPRPNSSTLFISDPQGLGIRLGIRVPESIVARILISSDGQEAWALSESGMIYLPLGRLYEYPILQPETTAVFLTRDECNRGLAQASVRINNLGSGKLTFSVPTNLTPALIMQATSGLAPAEIEFTMEPGRLNITRQGGTNLATGAATMSGNVVNVDLASLESINIPNTIRVYMNYRLPDQRGLIFPVPTTPNNNPFNVVNPNQGGGNEGLKDIVLDEPRRRLYISNSGYNRIEIFELDKQRFLTPIPVGQLPHKMELASDGTTLYVAETGGESISLVDLELGRVTGHVEFPPLPRAANSTPVTVTTMAAGLFGLQFVMSNGSQWKVVGNQAIVRPANSVTPAVFARGPGNPPAFSMLTSPNRDRILTLAGDGQAFLYDSLADTYITGRTLFTTPIQSYYGPLAVAGQNSFMLTNGLILNDSLTVIGGAERPGIQTTTPGQPGQPPVISVISAGSRNVAASAALDNSRFVRLTTTVRQAINTAVRDEVRATLEIVNLETGSESLIGVVAENPEVTVLGTNRVVIPPRRMVVDSQGTAYALTISGLSVISTEAAVDSNKPAITARSVLNAIDGTPVFRPGSFITVSGQNLAFPATADTLPPPLVLGGSCVTFNDISLPLLQTSSEQILAQIPEDLPAGQSVVQVRSLALAQSSDPVVITVQR